MPLSSPLARYPRHALLACLVCGDVFINWTGAGTTCRACGGAQLREIRRHRGP